MTISVAQKLSTNFTDTSMARSYQDPILTSGSLFLFDMLNAISNPNADGNIVNGATFANLMDGEPGATASTSGSHLQSLTGKAGLSSDGAGGASVGMGATAYDLSASNHEFWAWFWLKVPASGYTTANFQNPFSYSQTNANNSQWWFDMGTGGLQPRFNIGKGSSSLNVNAPNITPGSVCMIGGHWKSGVVAEIIINGGISTSTTASVPSSLQSGGSAQPIITNNIAGTIYRWGLEDLTVSGATAAGQAAAEYSLNHSRFT